MPLGKYGKMKEQLINIYSGKKIFITGHTGFKGAWLVKILNLLGAEIKGYALPPKNTNDLYNLLDGDTICESVIGDIRDRDKLKKALLDFNPDYIFHLAAQPLVLDSYQDPIETFEVNSLGTAYLLECIRSFQHSVNTIIITTDKVYLNREWDLLYVEHDQLGGYDPYSSSKACAELIISSYRNSFFSNNNEKSSNQNIAVARSGNVIGGGDWSKNRLIPDIAIAFSKDASVKIRNSDSVRPWQHVLEPLIGYLILGSKLNDNPKIYSDAFNFGPNSKDALTVMEILELAIKHWGKGHFELIDDSDKPHEASLLKLDISKAYEYLNWKPIWNADKAVKITIDWYKSYFECPDEILSFTEKQIIEYFNHG